MLPSGERQEQARQLGHGLAGSEALPAFDRRELHLVVAPRTLRQNEHAAWLARRRADPAEPATFP